MTGCLIPNSSVRGVLKTWGEDGILEEGIRQVEWTVSWVFWGVRPGTSDICTTLRRYCRGALGHSAASRLEFGARRLMNWFCKFDTVGVVFSVCARI